MAKYLDLTGLELLWSKIKTLVETVKTSLTKTDVGLGNVTNDAQVKRSEMGKANGVATLGADSKLTAAQLPALKTINSQSIVGSGNITIDLSLFKVVESLPTADIDATKIYLVKSAASKTGNIYTEYIYVEDKWEEFGTYKATIDLTPYVKFTDLATASKAGAMSAADKAKLDGLQNYTLPTASATAKGGVQLGYTANGKNYPVAVDANGKAYVNVPWTDNNTTYSPATASANGLMTKEQFSKLAGIATGATADSALTTAEIEAVCV